MNPICKNDKDEICLNCDGNYCMVIAIGENTAGWEDCPHKSKRKFKKE